MRPLPFASLAALLALGCSSSIDAPAPNDPLKPTTPSFPLQCAAVHASSSTTMHRTSGPDVAPFKFVATTSQGVFASTGTSLHRSTDGGTTWSLVDVTELRGANVLALASHAGQVYVSLASGLFRSSDGVAWQDVSTTDLKSPTHLSSDGTRFFAVQSGAVYQRDELAGTWTALPVDPDNFLGFDVVQSDGAYLYGNSIYQPGVFRIALTVPNAKWNAVPTLPEWGYTAFTFDGVHGFAGNATQVFQSIDSGATWAPVATTGQVYALVSLDGQLVAATADGVKVSTNDGATWTSSIDQKGFKSSSSLAASTSSLFFAGDGISRASSQGLGAWERLHPVADPISDLFATKTAVFAQSGTRVLRSKNAGVEWTAIGDAKSSYASFVVTNGGSIFAMHYSSSGEEIVRSDNDGDSFEPAGAYPGDPYTGFVQFLADTGDALVAGVTSGAGVGCTDAVDITTTLYVSTNGGATWKPAMNTFAPTFTDCYKKSFAPGLVGLTKASGVLFATSSHDGAFRSTNDGTTWQAITTPADVGSLSSVTAASGALVAIASAGGLARSIDGGVTWANATLAGTPVASLVRAGDVLYASVASANASDAGIYTSTNAGVTWTRVDSTFDARASRVVVQGGNLFAGTLDDSVWSASLSCE